VASGTPIATETFTVSASTFTWYDVILSSKPQITAGQNLVITCNYENSCNATGYNVIEWMRNGDYQNYPPNYESRISSCSDGYAWTETNNDNRYIFKGWVTSSSSSTVSTSNWTDIDGGATAAYVNNQIASGTATNVSGVVAVANGGTGATTAAGALTNLGAAPIDSPTFTGTPTLPTGTIGVTQTVGDNTTALATTAFVTATASSSNFVDLTTDQTVAGAKTFSSDITVNGLTVGMGGGSIATNTAIGTAALYSNTTGFNNTANGNNSLKLNTTGYSNTATGLASLASNSTGSENTANGVASLAQNSTGSQNTANGVNALYYNTTGNNNTANGLASLEGNTSGSDNTANGSRSLVSNTTGYNNTATGSNSLKSNIIGFGNTANGVSSLQSNAFGNENTAIGNNSLFTNTFGSGNTANGGNSLYSNTTGVVNTAIGSSSLSDNTIGYGNTATGYKSLSLNIDGFHNTAIGNEANVGSGNLNNATAIGNGATVNASNTIQLGNASVTAVNTNGALTTGDVTYPKTHGTNGQVLTTTGTGALVWTSPDKVLEADEEISAGAGQTVFYLGNIPTATSKVKMYVNGIRISKTAYDIVGTTLTYNPSNNGNKNIAANDRIQFEYTYIIVSGI
jgi:hypothetical protein